MLQKPISEVEVHYYSSFLRKNRDSVDKFFAKETKDMIGQLCDLFEEKVKEQE